MTLPPDAVDIEIAGERLVLLPQRAVWWPARDTVLVADVHLGKAATFRAAAIPIPSGTTRDNLDRLAAVLDRTGARRLVVLGDLYHALPGRTQELRREVLAWRDGHADVDLVLVRGNHDRHAGDPEPSLGMTIVDEPFRDAPFVLRHHPEPSPDGFVLAGHLHPAVALSGPAGQHLRLACFHFSPGVGVLPAFGMFTGTHRVRPRKGDRVFVCTPGRIMPIPSSGRAGHLP